MFACGFESGAVRVFNVSSTSMLAEHRFVFRLIPTNSTSVPMVCFNTFIVFLIGRIQVLFVPAGVIY